MSKHTLKSGRKVELKPLTASQRLDCKDAVTYKYKGDEMTVIGLPRQQYLYAMKGLGLESIDAFDEDNFTDKEILEVGAIVATEDDKGKNPTKKAS